MVRVFSFVSDVKLSFKVTVSFSLNSHQQEWEWFASYLCQNLVLSVFCSLAIPDTQWNPIVDNLHLSYYRWYWTLSNMLIYSLYIFMMFPKFGILLKWMIFLLFGFENFFAYFGYMSVSGYIYMHTSINTLS